MRSSSGPFSAFSFSFLDFLRSSGPASSNPRIALEAQTTFLHAAEHVKRAWETTPQLAAPSFARNCRAFSAHWSLPWHSSSAASMLSTVACNGCSCCQGPRKTRSLSN